MFYINLTRFYELKRHGQQAQGVVTNLIPNNHREVDDSFVVNGRSHAGRGVAGYGNAQFRAITLGYSVIVYYLPEDPTVSCLGIPQELFANELTTIVLAGFTFPIFAMIVYAYRYPRFKNWLLASAQR